MGKGIVKSGQYELANITLTGTKVCWRSDACGLSQWELPIRSLSADGMPPREMVDQIREISNAFRPDLIHVWGTERFWGLLTARNILETPALLEMQGIPGAMVPYMTGCLTSDEIRACFGLKEFLRPRLSLTRMQHQYAQGWAREKEIITGHRFIDYESDWVKCYLDPIAIDARLFKTRMILRSAFLTSKPWSPKEGNFTVFSSCGYAANKGLHTLIRAMSLLKTIFPGVTLELAGGMSRGIRTSGYQKWIVREIARLGLENSVRYLGQLDSDGLVAAMHRCAVAVVPSLVESYSMSLAEAMAVGCPCVASFAGAMPEVGGGMVSYVPLADAGALSGAISRILRDREFAANIGRGARIRSMELHQIEAGVKRQLEIYGEVI